MDICEFMGICGVLILSFVVFSRDVIGSAVIFFDYIKSFSLIIFFDVHCYCFVAFVKFTIKGAFFRGYKKEMN